jgi:hypothetical protein
MINASYDVEYISIFFAIHRVVRLRGSGDPVAGWYCAPGDSYLEISPEHDLVRLIDCTLGTSDGDVLNCLSEPVKGFTPLLP